MTMLSSSSRYADTVSYGLKSKRQNLGFHERKKFTILRLYEDADSAMLRMIECFFEAAPQLILQLYIIMIQGHRQDTTKCKSKSIDRVFL